MESQLLLKKLYYSVVYNSIVESLDDSILKGKYMELEQYVDVYEDAEDKWKNLEEFWTEENIVIPERMTVEKDISELSKEDWQELWNEFQEYLIQMKKHRSDFRGKPLMFMEDLPPPSGAEDPDYADIWELKPDEKNLPIDSHLIEMLKVVAIPMVERWVYKTAKYFGLPPSYANQYHAKLEEFKSGLPKYDDSDKASESERKKYIKQLDKISRKADKLREEVIKDFKESKAYQRDWKTLDESAWKNVVVEEIKAYAQKNNIGLGRATQKELYADFVEDIGDRKNLSDKYKEHLKTIAEEVASKVSSRISKPKITYIGSGKFRTQSGEIISDEDAHVRAKTEVERAKDLEDLKGKSRILLQQLIEGITQPGLKPHKVPKLEYDEEAINPKTGKKGAMVQVGEKDWRSALKPKKRNWQNKKPKEQIEYDPRESTDPQAVREIAFFRKVISERDKTKQLKLIQDSNLDIPQLKEVEEALKVEIKADERKNRGSLGKGNVQIRTKGREAGERVSRSSKRAKTFSIGGRGQDWGNMRVDKYETALGQTKPFIQDGKINEEYFNVGTSADNILQYWLNEIGTTPTKYRRMGKAAKATVAKKIAELKPPRYPEPSDELRLAYRAFGLQMGNNPLKNARQFPHWLKEYVDTVKAKFSGEVKVSEEGIVQDLLKFEETILPKLVEMVEQGINIDVNTGTIEHDFVKEFDVYMKKLKNRDEVWALVSDLMIKKKSFAEAYKGVKGVTELREVEDRIKNKLRRKVVTDVPGKDLSIFNYLLDTAIALYKTQFGSSGKATTASGKAFRKRGINPIAHLIGFDSPDIKVETRHTKGVDWLDHNHALYRRFTPNMKVTVGKGDDAKELTGKEAIEEMKKRVFAELNKFQPDQKDYVKPTPEEIKAIDASIDEYIKGKSDKKIESEADAKAEMKRLIERDEEIDVEMRKLRQQLKEGDIDAETFNRAYDALGLKVWYDPKKWNPNSKLERYVDSKRGKLSARDIQNEGNRLWSFYKNMEKLLSHFKKKDYELMQMKNKKEIDIEEYLDAFEKLAASYQRAVKQLKEKDYEYRLNRDDFKFFSEDTDEEDLENLKDESEDVDNMYIGKLLKADVGPILESLDKKKKKKLKALLSHADPTDYFGQDFLKLGELVDMLKQLGIVKGDAKLKKKIIRYEDENIKVVKLASKLRKDYEGLYRDLRQLVYPKSGGGTR